MRHNVSVAYGQNCILFPLFLNICDLCTPLTQKIVIYYRLFYYYFTNIKLISSLCLVYSLNHSWYSKPWRQFNICRLNLTSMCFGFSKKKCLLLNKINLLCYTLTKQSFFFFLFCIFQVRLQNIYAIVSWPEILIWYRWKPDFLGARLSNYLLVNLFLMLDISHTSWSAGWEFIPHWRSF